MALRKTGTCELCKQPMYGDDYGAAGHWCEGMKAKPDGWILWDRDNDSIYHAHFYETHEEALLVFGGSENVDIRPVRLTFLDDDKEGIK